MKQRKVVKGERDSPYHQVFREGLKATWEGLAVNLDVVMLRAACCLAFFGLLRIGEITVPSNMAYDPGAHLSYGDIAVDDPSSPAVI